MNADDYIKNASRQIKNQEWDNAITNLKLAEEIDPNNPAIHLYLFNVYGMTRNNQKLAKEHFLIFQKLEPEKAKELLDDMPDFIREDLGL